MFVTVAVEVEDDVAILSDRQRMAHSVEEHAVRVVALLARLPRDADLDLAVDFRTDLDLIYNGATSKAGDLSFKTLVSNLSNSPFIARNHQI